MKKAFIGLLAFAYQYVLKNLFFLVPPETVHTSLVHFGEFLGSHTVTRHLVGSVLDKSYPELSQKITGINFTSPIGLSAGFDYEARLTQILPALGFGFGTVGTITHYAYEGNTRPMLGRLPRSRSLMVNKGFKNLGAIATCQKLDNISFAIPTGISIGRTNSLKLKTQKQSIADIITAFSVFEMSNCNHAYYELNISCPNLKGDVTFYPPDNLKELLTEVSALNLSRPLFIKMPIEKSDKETMDMLEVIVQFPVEGVIFGNLQKNRNNALFYPEEVHKFPIGNFSGKPTELRSNELIALSYRYYGQKLKIIGCGGVFSGRDAYTKIILGASLVQLITGMIYKGPQLITQMNNELVELLKKDGFKTISQAVGRSNQSNILSVSRSTFY